jgi:uncharacterized protein (TIGR02391 family)
VTASGIEDLARITEYLPPPESLIEMPPEELGVYLLQYLSVQPTALSRASLVNEDSHLRHYIADMNLDEKAKYQVMQGLGEAWDWLESDGYIGKSPSPGGDFGGWRVIARKGQRLLQSNVDATSFSVAKILTAESLDPRLSSKVTSPFLRGEYESAVREAFVVVEATLRETSRTPSTTHGVRLIQGVFDENRGPLRNISGARRDAMKQLCIGAFALYRNPAAHGNVTIQDPGEAARVIQLCDLLLRLLMQASDD